MGAGTIAFQVYGEASNPKDGVYLVSADGTALHRLRNQPANSVAPRFSPDGNISWSFLSRSTLFLLGCM